MKKSGSHIVETVDKNVNDKLMCNADIYPGRIRATSPEIMFVSCANNTCADEPARMRRLISSFVVGIEYK